MESETLSSPVKRLLGHERSFCTMNASEQITNHINALTDWRGTLLARLRKLILAADPVMVEEWKWETPVWSNNGNVVAAGAFQDHVKLNFFKGASLPDPHGLFNAGLEAKASRAIDFGAGDSINEAALKELMRAAVALNSAKTAKPSAARTKTNLRRQASGPGSKRKMRR
jgi:hypothetical protein